MAANTRYDRWEKLRTHLWNLRQEIETWSSRVFWDFKARLHEVLPPARPRLLSLPKQQPTGRPSIQIPAPMWDISFEPSHCACGFYVLFQRPTFACQVLRPPKKAPTAEGQVSAQHISHRDISHVSYRQIAEARAFLDIAEFWLTLSHLGSFLREMLALNPRSSCMFSKPAMELYLRSIPVPVLNIFRDYLFFIYVYTCACLSLYVPLCTSATGGQRALDSLELDVQAAVSQLT